jgi:hypothetical protein
MGSNNNNETNRVLTYPVAVVLAAIIGTIGVIGAALVDNDYIKFGNDVTTEIQITQTVMAIQQAQTAIADGGNQQTQSQPSPTQKPVQPSDTPVVVAPTNTSRPAATFTNVPTPIPYPKEVGTPVYGTDELPTYNRILDDDEMIVGNAQWFQVSGSVYKAINNEPNGQCIVYTIRGPGTYTLNIKNGSINVNAQVVWFRT